MSHTDATSRETWTQFNPRLHKRIGWNIIKIKSRDNIMGTLKESVTHCTYNSTNRDWFKIIKPLQGPSLFIENKTAYSAIKSGFELESSRLICCLTSGTSLDANISEDSEVFNMLSELKDMDKKLTKALIRL